ncbi:MAG: hypothetical protein KBH99_06650 [Syntrophobacteraceae bacterium]|nr:hypothetical protein [Syntrophobacteraceae bacterium]
MVQKAKWTSKSFENIREELGWSGYKVSATTIGKILREQPGYLLHGLKKDGGRFPARGSIRILEPRSTPR